jgi:hypothetical protein
VIWPPPARWRDSRLELIERDEQGATGLFIGILRDRKAERYTPLLMVV